MEVAPLDVDALDAVEPAFRALAAHAGALDTGMGPVRPAAELWARRRARYANWLRDEPRARLFAARDGNALAGYLMLRAHPKWGSRASTDPVLDIETLAVVPEARGRGAGHVLLEAVRAYAAAAGGPLDTTLGVSTANQGARRFYEREGFRPFTSRWFERLPRARPVPDGDGPRVEPFDATEVDRLAPLHRALDQRHDAVGPAYLPPRHHPATNWELERAEHVGPDRFILAAGDDGYVLSSLRDPGYDLWDVGPVGHVEALVVRPEGRSRGVGAALLHAAERELAIRGARALDLDVLEGNEAAQRFYAREGLTRVLESLYGRL